MSLRLWSALLYGARRSAVTCSICEGNIPFQRLLKKISQSIGVWKLILYNFWQQDMLPESHHSREDSREETPQLTAVNNFYLLWLGRP